MYRQASHLVKRLKIPSFSGYTPEWPGYPLDRNKHHAIHHVSKLHLFLPLFALLEILSLLEISANTGQYTHFHKSSNQT